MATSSWTDSRLSQLFELYRRLYWQKSRRLKTYAIRSSSLDCFGRCDFDQRVLLVDLSQHKTDRDIRATVLHEMVHAAIGRGGHHAPFWTQLESLLSKGAPITVGFPELGERGQQMHVIPKRFRRCLQLFRPLFKRALRKIERARVNHEYELTPAAFGVDCEESAFHGHAWALIWQTSARDWGFVDLDGKLLPWARQYRVEAFKGYRRGHRKHLQELACRAEFNALIAAQRKGGA